MWRPLKNFRFHQILPRELADLLTRRFKIRSAAPKSSTSLHEEGVVLVLGGAGYVGASLVRRLLTAGRKVRVVDSLIYGDDAIGALRHHPSLELCVGDCRKMNDMVSAMKNVDSVIHLAAIVGDPACEVNLQTALEINYAATRLLIRVAQGSGLSRFIFVSSCSVYRASDALIDESSPVEPLTLYGKSKLDSEYALLLARTESFHPVILRLATVFGLSSRPRFDLLVNLLTAKAVTEGAITIFNGEQWRPFIHVRDVAEGIFQILNTPLPVVSGEIFNLGDSRMNYTLMQLAEKIYSAVPGVRVEHVENSDHRNYRVSFDKVRDQVGFFSSHTLDEGILEIRRALKQYAITDYTHSRYYNQKLLKFSVSPSKTHKLEVPVTTDSTLTPAPTSD